ncbi:indole-3-glycerol phosphate synthase TrpC [Planctomycetales bacterium ZRK34]|nr:indole-3-glycerol phosphate synthase TrpC [Planctomycetales bacterium ZRK34]
MANILDQIIADKRREVAEAKAKLPLEHLEARAADTARPRNFFKAVTQSSPTINVIAEVKRASPSAGLIREDFDPVAIATAYHAGGAAAISCLTDQKYFQGDLSYIDKIKAAVPLPVLRKDFIIDPYQLYESRVAGADAVLLIAECLDEARLIDLLILATQLQLTVLLEVHEMDSLLKVRPHIGFPHAGYCLLGINNRDLKSMTTDLNHTLRLVDMVENRSILVSESGIRTHDDVVKLKAAGIGAVLVGENLMKQPDVETAIRQLIDGDGQG